MTALGPSPARRRGAFAIQWPVLLVAGLMVVALLAPTGLRRPLPRPAARPGRHPDADRIAVRFTAFDRPGASYDPPQFEDNSLPRALLTMRSSVSNPDLSAAIAGSLADAAVNVLVTDQPQPDRAESARIRHIGFVPLARLLPDADLVVSAGGTGTMLSALAAGLPLVIQPQLADQPLNAARATRLGAARTIADATEAGAAAHQVLTTPGNRRAARQVMPEIGERPVPAEVLAQLLARIPAAAA